MFKIGRGAQRLHWADNDRRGPGGSPTAGSVHV